MPGRQSLEKTLDIYIGLIVYDQRYFFMWATVSVRVKKKKLVVAKIDAHERLDLDRVVDIDRHLMGGLKTRFRKRTFGETDDLLSPLSAP